MLSPTGSGRLHLVSSGSRGHAQLFPLTHPPPLWDRLPQLLKDVIFPFVSHQLAASLHCHLTGFRITWEMPLWVAGLGGQQASSCRPGQKHVSPFWLEDLSTCVFPTWLLVRHFVRVSRVSGTQSSLLSPTALWVLPSMFQGHLIRSNWDRWL